MRFLRCISKRYSIWLGILLVAKSMGISAVYAKPVVVDVRSYDHGKFTRFVIDLSEKVDYKKILHFLDPYRIVIDLPDVIWQAPPERQSEKKGLIASFHHGLFNAGTYRVVINLKSSAVVKERFMLPPEEGKRDRLVVDLMSSTRRAMLSNRAMEPTRNQMIDRNPTKNFKFEAPRRKPKFIDVHKFVVVIDPGHGGIDPGATANSRMYEKYVVLAVAKALKKHLEKIGNYKVYLTRNTDTFLPLRKRTSIARDKGADLFISLHADAIANRNIRGMSVYTLSKTASNAEAEALAKRENKSDLIPGVDLGSYSPQVADILIDLSQGKSKEKSSQFAKILIENLGSVGRMLPTSLRSAGFAVLKSLDVASVLVELGFLSNSRDSKALSSKSYRSRIAGAMSIAVDSYFDRLGESGRD